MRPNRARTFHLHQRGLFGVRLYALVVPFVVWAHWWIGNQWANWVCTRRRRCRRRPRWFRSLLGDWQAVIIVVVGIHFAVGRQSTLLPHPLASSGGFNVILPIVR
jgi:hypothetical protein